MNCFAGFPQWIRDESQVNGINSHAKQVVHGGWELVGRHIFRRVEDRLC